MSTTESTTSTPAAAVAATPAVAGIPAEARAAKAKPGMKAAVGTVMAAATLAAVTVLSGPVLSSDPASILASPVNSTQSRIAGVHEDMVRAVALRQVTLQQAEFLENQLVRHIKAGGTA